MSNTDTLVSRRLLSLVTTGVPGGVPEDVIKQNQNHAALFHRAIAELCGSDISLVDMSLLSKVLQGGRISVALRTKKFRRGVLAAVRSLGGQFAQARMTEIVGGETLVSQRDNDVIRFWNNWHFNPEEEARLTVGSSISSQVIYLPDLVKDSLNCSSVQVEGKKSVAEIIASLPKVEGLRWIVGNTPTINRVLANHLKETNVYLLQGRYTWTTDEYNSVEYGLRLLIVGVFHSRRVNVNALPPVGSDVVLGLFILGVPK